MILLTGATGKTGGVAAKALAEKGANVRALVRDAEKAAPLAAAGIELVVGDVENPDSVARALDGVSTAVMILPNRRGQLELENTFTDAAASADVRHFVKLSSMEASADATAPIPQLHYASEEHIKASGMAWTMIKPNFFMQNLFGNAATIKSQGKFFLPLGDGKAGLSDARDIGAVIAHVVTSEGHEGKSYEITGPELLDFHQVAQNFSDVLGKPVEYVNQPLEEYRAVLSQYIPDEWHTNAVCQLFAEIADGGLDSVTDTAQTLLGRAPISLAQFIEDHRAVFS
jgi:uncharacterized protein YbjT (DUF2867 family)